MADLSNPDAQLQTELGQADAAMAEVMQLAVVLEKQRDQLVAALKAITATKPMYGMDPNAIVGSANGISWNVHGIARHALASVGAA